MHSYSVELSTSVVGDLITLQAAEISALRRELKHSKTEYEWLKNERHSASMEEAKELGGDQIKLVSGLLSILTIAGLRTVLLHDKEEAERVGCSDGLRVEFANARDRIAKMTVGVRNVYVISPLHPFLDVRWKRRVSRVSLTLPERKLVCCSLRYQS